MSIGEGLKAFNWITQRIDQVSAWVKKKVRLEDVKKIDNAVRSGDDATLSSKLRSIQDKADKRRDS